MPARNLWTLVVIVTAVACYGHHLLGVLAPALLSDTQPSMNLHVESKDIKHEHDKPATQSPALTSLEPHRYARALAPRVSQLSCQ